MTDIGVSSAVILLEAMTIVQCLEITFKKPIALGRYLFLLIGGICIGYTAINLGKLSPLWSVLIYLSVLKFCHHYFRYSRLETVIRAISGFMICGLMEIVTGSIIHFFFEQRGGKTELLLVSILVLFVVRIIRNLEMTTIKRKTFREKRMWIITAGYCLLFFVLLSDYYLNDEAVRVYGVVLMVFIFLLLICLRYMEATRAELEKKEYELKLQRAYEGTFEELLKEMRRKQHDYRNQLGAVYSMHLAAESLEELVAMQSEYIEGLEARGKYDSLTLSCNNKIMTCFLWVRFLECEREGVEVKYSIHLDRVSCRFSLHELIEILGIFLDNACESILKEEMEPREIRFRAYEGKGKVVFCIANPVREIKEEELERMFKEGYSSKGKGRGIGLARVKELAERYEAGIRVAELREEGRRWIEFTIETG